MSVRVWNVKVKIICYYVVYFIYYVGCDGYYYLLMYDWKRSERVIFIDGCKVY